MSEVPAPNKAELDVAVKAGGRGDQEGGGRAEDHRHGEVEVRERLLAPRHNNTLEEELEALLAEARARADELEALADGTYYSTVEQVWKTEYVKLASLGEDDLRALRRERGRIPSFVARTPPESGYDAYAETIRCALDPDFDAISTKSTATRSGSSCYSSSSSPSDDDDDDDDDDDLDDEVRYPKDALGREDLAGTRLAHMVPIGHSRASLYGDVAMCALGLGWNYGKEDEDDDDDMASNWATIQKAIHGCREKGTIGETAEQEQGSGAALGYESDSERMAKKPRLGDEAPADRMDNGQRTSTTKSKRPRTGLQHMVPNKVRLVRGQYFFDESPCVLIVPAMDLAEVRTWNGHGYPALYLVDKGMMANFATVKKVCGVVGMRDIGDVASPEQIEQGRRLLAQVVRGMAYSLRVRSVKWDECLGERAHDMLVALRRNFEAAAAGHGGVAVPEPRRRQASSLSAATGDDDGVKSTSPPVPPPLRVRLVTFDSAIEPGAGGHPAPDPLLLAVRAAVNWSRRHRQALLSFDKNPDNHGYYELPEERYLEFQDEIRRARASAESGKGADANDESADGIPAWVTFPSG